MLGVQCQTALDMTTAVAGVLGTGVAFVVTLVFVKLSDLCLGQQQPA
jgi:hypothetical protein